ncbi:MAG TPA: TonB-dependent receptor [Chitinophagaceae bacterium]
MRKLACLITLFTLFFTVARSQDQGKVIKGKVVDETTGKGIPGVSVILKGNTTGTQTNNDGAFSITAPSLANAQLEIGSVGYERQVVDVKGRTELTVRLKLEAKGLEDVVVIGYGTQSRRNVSGAQTSFDVKTIEEKPIARVDQAMIGQMPGVVIKQQTGMPGQGFSLTVRGPGSIAGGTEPLYVIDGFPLDVVSQGTNGSFTANPLNNINPNDIESIQVLKDAAAAAIYGSRAANGVVLITTKRGQIGKTKISVNAYGGTSSVAKKMDVLSPQEWIDMSTELDNYKYITKYPTASVNDNNAQRRIVTGTAAGAYSVQYMNDDRWTQPGHPGLRYVNWQDEAFRPAPFQNYEVSASGGNENVRYFFSGAYLDQKGVLLNSGYKNYSARANIEVNASKRFKMGFNLAPSYAETATPLAEGKDAQLMHLFNMTPIVEDSAGLLSGAGKNAVYQWASSSVSPVAYLNNTISLYKTTRILYSMYGELTLAKGLSARSSINYDESNQTYKRYISDFVAGNISNYLNIPGRSSSGAYSGFKKQNIVNENTINYNITLKEKHTITAIAGMSYSFAHTESYTLSTANGFNNDAVNTLNNASPTAAGVTVTGNTTETNNALMSYFARVQYSYLGKYLLSGSIRRDASSRFGIDSRWGTFPSLSAGWRISDENFMKNVRFVSDLKLRASWGRAGSSNIGDYQAIPTLANANYSFGTTAANGEVPSGVASPNLHWETSNTYDLGLDATVLKNRINMTFDVYRKVSTDLFLQLPTLAASGFLSALQNIGQVQNQGLELGLNLVPVMTKSFQWSINANVAFNQNKVLKLGIDGAPINVSTAYTGNPPFLLQVGLPMYSYSLIKSNGILTAADIADPKVAKLPLETVGDTKYVDKDGNGIIDANDRLLLGQPNPKSTWGLTNNFRYKAFDLSIQMYGQEGGVIYSFLGRATDNPANGRNTTNGIWRDRWTATNQNYNAPRGKIGEAYTIPLFTSDWLYSSNFFRIQNITLGYNLKSIISSGIFSGARIYASLQNYFDWDKYKGGVNPEAENTNVSGSSAYPLPGDYGAMPLNKTITFGVNFSF